MPKKGPSQSTSHQNVFLPRMGVTYKARAPRRQPHSAALGVQDLIKFALLRAAQSLLILFCVALNRADDFNARGPQGGASRLMPLRSALG